MSEKALEARCMREARARGYLLLKWSSPAQGGVPDRLLFALGWVVPIEFKAPGRPPRLSKLQKVMRNRIEKQGVRVCVCNSFEQFCNILDEVERAAT